MTATQSQNKHSPTPNQRCRAPMSTATASTTGRVSQVIGSTFDVEFPSGYLPPIYNALQVQSEHKGVTVNLVGEVQQHLGGSRVRAIALGSTEGMMRGMEVVDTGKPVTVPVGKATLGRVFNVLGQPIDQRGEVAADDYWPIHRQAPPVNELSTSTEVFETGIKVIDLLTPFVRGGKAGLFGGDRTDRSYRQQPRRLFSLCRRR